MTGVQYGDYDLNWILRSLSKRSARVADADGRTSLEERIVVDGRRGLSCLEDYLLGLFNLYKHVYYHKTILAAEGMMMKLLSRAIRTKSKQIRRSPALKKVSAGQRPSVHEYLGLDDSVIMSWLHEWSEESTSDEVLRDLSTRLLNRQLLKAVPFNLVKMGSRYAAFDGDVRQVVTDRGFDSEYYVIVNEPKRAAYKDYWFLQEKNKLDQEVFIVDPDNKIRSYTSWVAQSGMQVGQAIVKLTYGQRVIIVPSECETDVKRLIEEAEK